MADLSAKKSDFISEAVQRAEAFIAAYKNLHNSKLEYDSMGYNSAGANALVDGDFIGANAHLDAAKMTSLMNTALDIHNLIATSSGTQNNSAGKLTNLYAAAP